MTFDAVLFDCDGVLVDSEMIATRALYQSLQDIDLPMTMDKVFELFTGQSFPHCVAIIEDLLDGPVPEGFIAQNRHYFRILMQDELVTMPGVKQVLLSLPLPFAVVTNSQTHDLDIKLTHTGLDHFFPLSRRFDAEALGVSKPDPEIYRRAATALGVDIKRCLVVEDSVPGITAGVASGAQVWAYRPHLTQAQLQAFGVTRVLSDWTEFSAQLDINTTSN